jgi:Na+-translocating ferredoxin:NAD+ oxidoreductase RNF subunit RnfB
MKHWEQKFTTYVYNHCNICNIPIYFCNIHTKHLQQTSETLETYAYNMCFQRNIYLLLG